MKNMKKIIILGISCLTHQTFAQAVSEKKEDANTQSFDDLIYDWLKTFSQVLSIADNRHYKIKDVEKCMSKAIDGFMHQLDPHSSFLDPKTYKRMIESTSGEFCGAGIVIDNTRSTKDNMLLVIDTIPGGPADKAGMKPLDKIIEIEGESLDGMSTDEAMIKIKGERNTTVTLKVMRDGQQDPLTFTITRDTVKEQNSLCYQLDNHGIYYLSLSSFTDTALKQIESLLKKSQEKKYRALILDLRNNSGGLLTSVVDIAGLFLEKGSLVVSIKDKHNKITAEHRTTRDPIHTDTPIFILINNYTASAAEILSGCLKIHSEQQERGGKKLMVFLVGSKTFGKGSVQDVIPIGNNCAIKITESLYFLPNDTCIQAQGITPDFEIEKMYPPTEQMVWFKKFYGAESASDNHIPNPLAPEEKKEKKAAAKDEKLSWAEKTKKNLETDNQLRETITLINIYHMGIACNSHAMATRKGALDFMNKIHVNNKPLNLVEVKN